MKVVIYICIFVLAAFAVAACGSCAKLWRELQEEKALGDRRDEAYRSALVKLAEVSDKHQEQLASMALKVAEIEKKLDDLPLEEMEEEYRSLAAFNEGVQNIMGFGPNVPKLNKEGVKRGG